MASMSFEKRVPLFALVETLDTELCRAKLLAPLSLEVVANNWIQAKRLLEQGLSKHVRRRAPSLWAKTRPMDVPEQRKIKVTLKPAKNDFVWIEPIEVCVDMFSWSISGTNRQWICPALETVLVTNDNEVSDAFLELQIRNMLARKYDQLVLRDVLSLFGNRQFRVQEFMVLDPESVEQYYVDNKKSPKKNKLVAVRSVATRVATWQHLSVFEQGANIAKLRELMLNSNPQSVLLVGPRGVGKTAIVYQLACSLVDRVWATSGARLVSGMCGLGMWQQRCHRVIREAHDAQLILHLGSLVELIESGKINGQPGVASLMRGAIDRGQLLAIAECTPEQLSVVQREDPLLLRCFTQIEISPTDETTTLAILKQIAELLSADQVTITQDAIQELYRLHQRFSTYSAMPGQPISLLRSMIDECPVGATISKIDVSQRFSKDTGLPTFLLDDSVSLDIEQIRTTLSSNVIGQPEPIEHIVRLITMLKARLNRTDRPLASLLLIGPTGVGKTETAKALARLLYRDHDRMIRIDMSEYSQPWSALRLIGAPNEGDGTLTSPIRDQPFSVVLLDEFEKCHPTVLDLLLQVLGEGRLTDSLGNIADFRNAVIILTSNLGVESFHGRSFGFGSSETAAHEHFLREVRRHVRPELLGRIDQIIPYRALPLEVVRQITDRELAEVSKRSGIRYHPLQWDVEPDARDLIAQMGYDPRYGARPLRREIERQIVIPLADCLNTHPNQSNPKVTFRVLGHNRLSGDSHPTVVANVVNIPQAGKLSESNKQRDMVFVDLVRDLRCRADLLIQSPPYHALENNVERIDRQISQLQKRMRQLTSNRRQKQALYQIKTLQQQHGTLRKKVEGIKELASQTYQLHQQSMIDWYAQELEVSSELQIGRASCRERV